MNQIEKAILRNPTLWLGVSKVILMKKLGRQKTLVRTHGVSMMADLRQGKGMWCSVGGLEYEPEMRALIGLLGEGDVFIDVGANVGVFSLHAARKVGAKGRVYAYEPTPETYAALLANVELNALANLKALNMAAGASEGTLDFAVCESYNSNHLVSSSSPSRENMQITKVPVDTLDAMAARENIPSVSVIKIDAEGFEAEVMEGAREIIGKWRPTILFESFFAGDAQEDRNRLLSMGYRLLRLDGKTWTEDMQDYNGNILGVAREDHAAKLGV